MSNFPIDIDSRVAELSKRGKAYAELNAAYEALDDFSKSLLAKLAGDANDGSEASRERYARAHEDFLRHLGEKGEARTLAAVAKVNYDVYRVWLDLKRSEASYTKAEMGIL